jgi:hypothetical protein
MRIALINVQLLDGNNVVAPLGVLYVAGQLEADGHTVAVFDGDPGAFPLADEIVAWRPELIGIGFLTAAPDAAFVSVNTSRIFATPASTSPSARFTRRNISASCTGPATTSAR